MIFGRKNLAISILLVCLTAGLFAADRESKQSGNWSNKCTWDLSCNQSTPNKNDNISIYHDVILDVSLTGGNQVKGLLYIGASGSLTDASGGSSFSMRIQNLGGLIIDGDVTITGDFELQGDATLTVTSGSTLSIGSNATFSTSANVYVEAGGMVNITGDLSVDGNADSVRIDGTVNVGGDFTNGAGADVTGDGQINISGTVDNDGDVFGAQGANADCTDCSLPMALPVELVSFSGAVVNGVVELKWTTAMELDNSHFEIERSFDVTEWETIGAEQGNGNTNASTSYSFIDVDQRSQTVFYRLKQVDFSGSFSYSWTIKMTSSDNAFENANIRFVHQGLLIDELPNERVQVEIYNLGGQRIHYETLGASATHLLQVNNTHSHHVLIVRLTGGGSQITKKVLNPYSD